jgi:hypothetical protein
MDYRTRREKLSAMAEQTVSPREAEIARRLLSEMTETPTLVSGELTRESILAQPNTRHHGAERVYDPILGAWVILDTDDVREWYASRRTA